MTGSLPQVVFVAGLSGSGKTTAMAALEDLAFYCVDNLPAQLVEQFVQLCQQATPPIDKIALAVETREAQFLADVPAVVARLRDRGATVRVLYLDCAEEVLVKRYRETRRVHPLAPRGSVEDGVAAERAVLADVAHLADVAIDTSSLNVHELKAEVVRRVAGAARPSVVNLVSFGFRHAVPQSLELLFDVRFLPNPYFEDALRDRTGLDPEVAAYVLESERGAALLERLHGLLDFLMPLYDAEGKAYLSVGIGCTGGHHRSVAIVAALAAWLRDQGREVNVEHRDVERQR
jgi:RNase adapter protein RapZ